MGKTIKAKSDYGVNTIMDTMMVPDGFARVVDGLDNRSGVCRPWQAPSTYRPLASPSTQCIWEYRDKWYESDLYRTYHGEYLYGQEAVYFTEEGEDHLPPQKIIGGVQVRLGTRRPLGSPLVGYLDSRYPPAASIAIAGAGAVPVGIASYRIAGIDDNGAILPPTGSLEISVITTPASIQLTWRQISGVTGYAIFGRTLGSERLLIKLGNVAQWTDDGSTAPGSETASAYDVSKSYQYVYTYYRNVGNVTLGQFLDESGPSGLSAVSDSSKIPIISRTPSTDGFYGEDTYTYPLYTIASPASSLSISASKTPGSTATITACLPNSSGTLTTITTQNPHGFTDITKGYVSGNVQPTSIFSVELTASIPFPLATPTFGFVSGATGGTLTPGTYSYQLVAVRGDTTATYGNPAQTLGNTVSATVGAGQGSVILSLGAYSSGTDAFIVYRGGVAVAIVPITLATWTDTGYSALAGVSYPSANETSTRCLSIPGQSITLSGGTGLFAKASTDITISGSYPSGIPVFAPNVTTTTIGTTNHIVGDVVFLSGLKAMPELNGAAEVIAYNSGTGVATINKILRAADGTSEATVGATLLWRPWNGYYSGWRIYRVGDTSEFLLVADLSLDTLSFTDDLSVNSLGQAIPSAYMENGLQVVYDRAPDALKRMVTHYGIRFGIVDDIVRWTPTGVPDAWPDVYYAAFPSRPVALVPFRQILCVLCEDGLYGLVGNTPSTLSPAGPFSNLGCIAPFSAKASNYGLLWLGKDGIIISHDGMSAECITSTKAPGRFFYAPSTPSTDGSGVGLTWWLPTNQTVQFAESMQYENINSSFYPVTQVANDLPIQGEMYDIRSFYWEDRYFLYYSGRTMHARSAMICIDMSRASTAAYNAYGAMSGRAYSPDLGLPLSTLPIKPVDVHVSLGGDCFMLLSPIPVTTVIITSPL